MSNEFGEPNADVEEPDPETKRAPTPVPTYVYILVAVLLAATCIYLFWLHGQDQAVIQYLRNKIEQAQSQYKGLKDASKEAIDTFTELADHAANRGELHRSQGNRKQALADVAQARRLLNLAKKLTTGEHYTYEMKQTDAKLTKLIKTLQPTPEERAMLEPQHKTPPTMDKHMPIPNPYPCSTCNKNKKRSQLKPEQLKVSGEKNSGGESDA